MTDKKFFWVYAIVLTLQFLAKHSFSTEYTVTQLQSYSSNTISRTEDTFDFRSFNKLQPKNEKFIIVFVDIELMSESDNDTQPKLFYKDMILIPDGGEPIIPSGKIWPDLNSQTLFRFKNIDDETVDLIPLATPKEYRLGLVYQVQKEAEEFILDLASTHHKLSIKPISEYDVMDNSVSLSVTNVKTQQNISFPRYSQQYSNLLPDAQYKVSNPYGQLLVVNLDIQGKLKNVSAYKTSFKLNCRDFAIVDRGQVLMPHNCNRVSPKTNFRYFSENLAEYYQSKEDNSFDIKNTELVFFVKNDFKQAELFWNHINLGVLTETKN